MLRQAPGSSFVAFGFERCRPFYIPWSVGTVIVDSIQHQASRRFAYIFQKGLKAVAPPITDRNTATAIILESLVFGIKAALFHRRPTLVHTCSPTSMGASKGAKLFAMEASTTNNQSAKKAVASDSFLGSTIASAVPHCSAVFVHMRKADSDHSTKTLTGEISKCRHAVLNSIFARKCIHVKRGIP